MEALSETVDFSQIKQHYYAMQRWVNPSGTAADAVPRITV